MAIIIGSARHDEHGNCYKNGSAGDQLQTSSTNDMGGEVSMQSFYIHSKGWYVLRLKSDVFATKAATLMKTACNNANIGYDQNQREGILKYGISTKTKTECDCGTLVREVIKEATGTDPGSFTTVNEKTVLEKSGLFDKAVPYTSGVNLCNGDVLVTKTKGHTAIIVSGATARSISATSGKPTVASGTPTLKKGSTGIEVKYLQQDLNYLGFRDQAGKSLTVDGDYGSKTEFAVEAFQDKYALTRDGKYGSKSEKAMKKAIG
jgi:hypothetical protein